MTIKVATLALLTTTTLSAYAGSIQINADYFDMTSPNSERALRLTVVVDDSVITGVGVERALAHYAGLLYLLNDVGQHFSLGQFSDPLSFDVAGNMFVEFVDGKVNTNAFFGTTGAPGTNPFTIFRQDTTGNITGVGHFAGNDVSYGSDVIFTRQYRIESYEIIPPPCPADLTDDGVLNFFDVSAFIAALNSGDPAADFNGDGSYDFFDVSAFLSAFSAGCP